MTVEEQAALNQQDTPVAPPTSTGANQPDYLSELEKLSELRNQGILTEEEFTAKKKQLLGL